jgi:hypothetical protein
MALATEHQAFSDETHMHPHSRSDTHSPSPVYSHNEWDPLEEVIVGWLEGATILSNHITVTPNLPRAGAKLYRLAASWRYPAWMKRLARRELDGFIELRLRRLMQDTRTSGR